MRVRLCGVRGSTPAPGIDFVGVGGHTSCVAIAHDEGPWCLLLDAGTGIRTVTDLLGGEAFRGTILFGHLHLDHTQGLPFFAAADRPDSCVRVLLPEQGDDALDVLDRCFSPPHFPISVREMVGSWAFGTIDEGEHRIEGFTVTALEVAHPGGRTFGYRIADIDSSIVYLSDHGPGEAVGALDGVADLARGVDALIHDSQFTEAEQVTVSHFGHATPELALKLAELAGAKRLVMFHHAPGRTDDQVEQLAAGLRRSDVEVVIGREGLELRLP